MKTRSKRIKGNGNSTSDEEMKTQNTIYLLVSVGLIILAFFILIEQYVKFGVFFEPYDFFHHEVIFGLLVALAIGIIIARYTAVKRLSQVA